MIVKLKYNESVCNTPCAAFIRGSLPGEWLKEINRWNIPVSHLECYIVPESMQSIQAVGMFVVCKTPGLLKKIDFLDTYGVVARRLYIPLNSSIIPEIDNQELSGMLLYDLQLFHPTIGMVGFDKTDRLDLADLLEYSHLRVKDWRLAHPGKAPSPRLMEIHIVQQSAKEIMESIKEEMKTKPLEEIPKPKNDSGSSTIGNIIDSIFMAMLKVGAFLIGFIPVSATRTSPTVFNRIQDWVHKNIEDLAKKRNDEINRLLKLFEENMEEALRYAIPLDSPYLNRGTAPPTSRLAPRSTDFKLSGLGGGQKVDSWDIGSYYRDLRQKYNQAAQKAIQAKDFKKAAYIYANLLGDFSSAAKVLEQGKHFREAAVLYKDHLKNVTAAAECFEKGGLLLEAIDLYAELHKYEKAADLYRQVGHEENAVKYYETTIEFTLKSGNYLDASRIISEKLQQPERNKEILLKGWKESNQSEGCLKKYFEATYQENSEKLVHEIQNIYARHTTKTKRSLLLNVLTDLIQQNKDEEVLKESRTIAYEVVSAQALEGNMSNLPVLKKFLPDDRLVSADCNLYMSNVKKSIVTPYVSTLQLDSTINWLRATSHRNQFIAAGIKDSMLYLARGNWYGNIEYHSWNNRLPLQNFLVLDCDPYASNTIILRGYPHLSIEEKVLATNKYFEEKLTISSPAWLNKGFYKVSFKPNGNLVALSSTHHSLTLHHCNNEGSLIKTTDCRFEGESKFLMEGKASNAQLIHRNGNYYSWKGNFLLKITENGDAQRYNLGNSITALAASFGSSTLYIVAGTTRGCKLFRPEEALLISDTSFAHDLVPIDIKFISSNIVAIAGKDKATIYQILDKSVKALTRYEAQTEIVAILPTFHRNKCAFLEKTGRIAICELEVE